MHDVAYDSSKVTNCHYPNFLLRGINLQLHDTPIFAGESRLLSIESLLKCNLRIPQFQRPYDWGDEQVNDFIDDLIESQAKGIPLFLGLIVLHSESSAYAIIDGQQRLTTLMLAIAALGGLDKVLRSTGGLMNPWVSPRTKDVSFAKGLMNGNPEPAATLSQWRMDSAFKQLRMSDRVRLKTLLQCEVIAYVAPNLSGATRLFERINLRGKKVCEFDLVKNRLIEWAILVDDAQVRSDLEAFITQRYDFLYGLLDPKAADQPYDSDKLLKVHWILFRDVQFKSGDRVLDKMAAWLTAEAKAGSRIVDLIERYLDSLVQAASIWVWVERPFSVSRPQYGKELHQALLDFEKLGREGELQPLLVSSIKRFGSEAKGFVRFCEINSFRAALAKKNSNHGRSVKWRLARQLYNDSLVDAQGRPIDTPEGLAHQLFWLNTPWWSMKEVRDFEESPKEFVSDVMPRDMFENPKFLIQYRSLVHYIFWKYGQYLLTAKEWRTKIQMDIDPFQEAVWFEFDDGCFLKWDIEHIYPQTPDDIESREGRAFQSTMEPWLNHLGNLTVLPIKDNRGMKNAAFTKKLEWMLEQQKVPFNQLLSDRSYTGNLMDKPHWGPNNCRKRMEAIRAFADVAWGCGPIQDLGVGRRDNRIKGHEGEEDDENIEASNS